MIPAAPAIRSNRFWNVKTALVVLLLLVLAGQCIYFAVRTGQTTDEGFFSGGGYPIVRYNDYKFLGDHPPLMYQLAAFPLLFIQPKFPIENPLYVPNTDRIDGARNGALFLYTMGNDPQLLLLLQRLPLIALTVLLGLGIFLFGKELYGEWGAFLALFLYVFTPDIIGNGGLFMTDMGLTAFYFFSIWALKRFFDSPDLKHAVGLGFLCGLAFVTKISGLILFPVVTFLFIVFFFVDPRVRTLAPVPATFDKRFGILAIFLLINAIAQKQAMVTLGPLFILAIYLCFKDQWLFTFKRFMPFVLKGLLVAGFVISFVFSFALKKKYGVGASIVFAAWNAVAVLFTLFLLNFRGENQSRVIAFVKVFLAIWLVAALVIVLDYTDFLYKFYRFIGFGNYAKPLGIVLSHSLGGHQNYIEGSFVKCDWRYFFYVMAIKVPLLVLGTTALGFVLLLRSRMTVLVKALLITPVIAYFGASIFNKINIGLRHILPIFPFLFLWCGWVGASLVNMKRGFLKTALAVGLCALLALFAARTLRTAPDYLAYFNEAIGGTEQGSKLIPINWGQDNKSFAEFVLARKIPRVKIISEASNPDIYDYYKLPWEWMQKPDLLKPEPGFYAMGIGVYVDQQRDPNSWFKGRQPDHRIGETMYIFEVPPGA
ncbi:MAG: glycosyltransferase family 39 protein [Candidatus Omnitrophota bacterium]